MRRKDREITDNHEIQAMIDRCRVCRIALQDAEGLYLIPMNFGYEYKDDRVTLYFHSAKQGRKIDAIGTDGCEAAFEMDGAHELTVGDVACEYGYKFESVMGTGRAVLVDNIGEKKHGLELIMKHQTRTEDCPEGKEFVFSDQMVNCVAVIRLEAERCTAKARKM